MTTREFVHRAEVVGTTLNGNADFWSAHDTADLIGGKVSDLANGFAIEGGRLYNFTNLSLDDVNVFVERVHDGSDTYFAITVRDADTSEELLYDDAAETLSEVVEVLSTWAPAPLFQELWDASELAQLGDPSAVYYNCMVITNFKWVDAAMKTSNVGQLAIYAHRAWVNDLMAFSPDSFYSVYHTAPGRVNAEDMKFATFDELMAGLKNYSELAVSPATI